MKPYNRSTVLVTGALGFIGLHLVEALIERGAAVVGLTKSLSEARLRKRPPKGMTLIEADIRDSQVLRRIVREVRPNKVFHLAGRIRSAERLQSSDDFVEVNLCGTIHLIQALGEADYDVLVLAGTCEEYGAGPVPFYENQPVQPLSPYAASKASATLTGQMLARAYGLPIATLRMVLVYGPRQDSGMFIPSLLRALSNRERFPMTKGEQTRDFLYVNDAVEAFLAMGEAQDVTGEILNIGSGVEVQLRNVVDLAVRLSSHSAEVLLGALPYRPGEVMRYVCANAKAKERLGWSPRVSLEEGLGRVVKWLSDPCSSSERVTSTLQQS